MKIFKAEYSHELEADKRVRFDLKRISNLTKHDVDAFGWLILWLKTGDITEQKKFETEFVLWSGRYCLLSGCIMSINIVSSTELSRHNFDSDCHRNAAHSLTIALNSFTTTRMPSLNITAPFSFQIQYVPDTMSEIIIIILLTVSVLFTIMIWFRYRRHTTYKFDLYLYIGANKNICPIWIRSFALDPSSYTFFG